MRKEQWNSIRKIQSLKDTLGWVLFRRGSTRSRLHIWRGYVN